MKTLKMGYIVKIMREDNLGVIREDGTLTEYLYFIDDTQAKLQVGTTVAFKRDEHYEQFVASHIKRIDPFKSKWAV